MKKSLSEERIAKINYDKTAKDRTSHLSNIRLNAIKEIRFSYPDAIFLINKLCYSFMATSEKAKIVIHGNFVDPFFPDIMEVQEGATPDDWNKAANLFRSQLREFQRGNFIKRHSGAWRGDFKKRMIDHGFRFAVTENKYISKGQLLKNGEVIMTSDFYNRVDAGQFSMALYDDVVNNRQGNDKGVSKLSFVLTHRNGPFTGDSFGYDIFYTDSYRASVDVSKEYLVKICEPLSRFFLAIDDSVYNNDPETMWPEDEMWPEDKE